MVLGRMYVDLELNNLFIFEIQVLALQKKHSYDPLLILFQSNRQLGVTYHIFIIDIVVLFFITYTTVLLMTRYLLKTLFIEF